MGEKNLHANVGRAAEQPASGGGSSSTLDQDIAQYRRLVETLRRQRDEERFCMEQRAKEEELAALRQEYEQLQSAVSLATPRVYPAVVPSVSRDLGAGWTWAYFQVPSMVDFPSLGDGDAMVTTCPQTQS